MHTHEVTHLTHTPQQRNTRASILSNVEVPEIYCTSALHGKGHRAGALVLCVANEHRSTIGRERNTRWPTELGVGASSVHITSAARASKRGDHAGGKGDGANAVVRVVGDDHDQTIRGDCNSCWFVEFGSGARAVHIAARRASERGDHASSTEGKSL